MASRAEVVISTVGPYAKYGAELVGACARNGTDYCDLTGETQFVRAMIDAHEDEARKTGARIVHLRRHPMDACFAMYKQSFFRFAYTLEDLASYYIAYDRLSRHWREHLGDRIVEVEYESLVSDPDARIRELLAGLGMIPEVHADHVPAFDGDAGFLQDFPFDSLLR